MMKHFLLAVIGLIGCAALAKAQIFPTRPVSIIVTSAPGGAADATARAVAGQLAKSWNQQVIVENKPGGNTQLAAEYVAKAAPDGHTLLLGPDVTFTVNPHLYLSYDPIKDFEPGALRVDASTSTSVKSRPRAPPRRSHRDS